MKLYILFALLVAQLVVNALLVVKLHRQDTQVSTTRPPTGPEQLANHTYPVTPTALDIRLQVDKSLEQFVRSQEFRLILGKIIEESLTTHQFTRNTLEQHGSFASDEVPRGGASFAEVETLYKSTQSAISDAIATGIWTAEDSDVLTQNLTQLPARQRMELMKIFVGAVNRQELQPEGNYFPF